jgi:outer membrane protein assembly factor BamB
MLHEMNWVNGMVIAAGALISSAAAAAPPEPAAPAIRPITPVIFGHRVGGVATDLAGNIYVADFGEQLWKITPGGERSILTGGLYGTSGNTVDSNGVVFQASCYGNTVVKVDRDGHRSRVAAGPMLNCPVGIAINPATHEIYATSCKGNAILRIGPHGTVSRIAVSPLFKCPNGLTIDSKGQLYTVNFRDNHMLKIGASGRVTQFATISKAGLGHVCFKSDRFYVTAYHSHELYEVTMDGVARRILGDGTRGHPDEAPTTRRLSFPNGIACDPWAPRLYINEFLEESPTALHPRAIVRVVELEPDAQ